MEKPLIVGTVVFSRAGRDRGRYFLVCDILDDAYVRIVDGDVRKISSPKKKKIKHLLNTGETQAAIADKLLAGKTVYDAEIFSALKKYNA